MIPYLALPAEAYKALEAFMTTIGIVATVTLGLITARRSKRAADNSAPVSNGFAENTSQALGRIEAILVRHLEDHARVGMLSSGRPPTAPETPVPADPD